MVKNQNQNLIYLDTYVLQKDYRIRLPKIIKANLKAEPGKTFFNVYLDIKRNEIILKISKNRGNK